MKRLLALLLPVLALPLLGGCAIAPDYRYSDSGDGGYYYSRAPYGGADTVVYGSGYSNSWGYGPWWYGSYYGGYGSVWGPSFGTSIYYYDRGQRYDRGGHGYPYRGSGQRHNQVRRSQPSGDWDGRGTWRPATPWHGNTRSQGSRPGSHQRSQPTSTSRPQRWSAPVQQQSRPSSRPSAPRSSRPASAPRGRALPARPLKND